MHAANLLNKRRREEKQRDEHPKLTAAAVAERDRDHRAVTKKTNSQTSFLDSIAGGVSTPTSSSAPAIPSVYRPPICTFPPPPPAGSHGNGYGSAPDPNPPEPLVLYHKQERISCAHIGLFVMIVGTIVTILAGFVCYLLGFGEPGVIIGGGGGIITIIGLLLLCFGSRWHLDELGTKKLPLIDYPLLSKDRSDLEAGRTSSQQQAETLEVSKVTNSRSDLNGKSGKAIVALKAPALEIDMICEEPETSAACGCAVNTRLMEEHP